MKSGKATLNKGEKEVVINCKGFHLDGILALPIGTQGVIFSPTGAEVTTGARATILWPTNYKRPDSEYF